MIDCLELANELVDDEGLKLTVYDDATGLPIRPGTLCKGHPTIGIGRCLDRKGITRDEAFYLLSNDIGDVKTQLTALLAWFGGLDGVRQMVLCNMAFNLGVHGLLAFHGALSLIAQGNYQRAGAEMLNSPWAKQVGARAARLAEMMRTGQPVKR